MRVDILTLFPDYFETPLNSSILKRAVNKNLLEIGLTDIRDFAVDKHGTVDDKPFGGGSGMIMKVDVLVPALEQVLKSGKGQKAHKIMLSPKGAIFNQKKAKSLAKKDWLILICGHYEGVDGRFVDNFIDEEISIGDYILTGGEPAALVLIDTVARLIPKVLGDKESLKFETFTRVKSGDRIQTILEYPQYTRPAKFRSLLVPKVLLSGDHKKIEKWRIKEALKETRKKRPDLLKS